MGTDILVMKSLILGIILTTLLSEPVTSIIRIINEKVDTALVYSVILTYCIIYTYVRRTLILFYTVSLGIGDTADPG
jgi:hypothetical protein